MLSKYQYPTFQHDIQLESESVWLKATQFEILVFLLCNAPYEPLRSVTYANDVWATPAIMY